MGPSLPASARRIWAVSALTALSAGCENEVSVQLLAKQHPGCVPGEACSDFRPALYFRGPYDHVEVPSSPGLNVPQDFCLEAWVIIENYAGGHGVLNRWSPAVADLQLTFGVPEPLPPAELPNMDPLPSHALASWAFIRPRTWVSVVAPTAPAPETWHHIAASYGGGSLKLYIDGTLVASAPSTELVPNPPSNLYIGATARYERDFDVSRGSAWWPPMQGFIADVRLSTNDRYPAAFVPQARLQADTSTIALWHLDEGQGQVANDSGAQSLHGAIRGATWALAPVRRSPP